MHNIIERSIEVQKDLYFCFIDYYGHDKLFDMLDRLNIGGKALRWLKKLYWEQAAAVRIENRLKPGSHQ